MPAGFKSQGGEIHSDLGSDQHPAAAIGSNSSGSSSLNMTAGYPRFRSVPVSSLPTAPRLGRPSLPSEPASGDALAVARFLVLCIQLDDHHGVTRCGRYGYVCIPSVPVHLEGPPFGL